MSPETSRTLDALFGALVPWSFPVDASPTVLPDPRLDPVLAVLPALERTSQRDFGCAIADAPAPALDQLLEAWAMAPELRHAFRNALSLAIERMLGHESPTVDDPTGGGP